MGSRKKCFEWCKQHDWPFNVWICIQCYWCVQTQGLNVWILHRAASLILSRTHFAYKAYILIWTGLNGVGVALQCNACSSSLTAARWASDPLPAVMLQSLCAPVCQRFGLIFVFVFLLFLFFLYINHSGLFKSYLCNTEPAKLLSSLWSNNTGKSESIAALYKQKKI